MNTTPGYNSNAGLLASRTGSQYTNTSGGTPAFSSANPNFSTTNPDLIRQYAALHSGQKGNQQAIFNYRNNNQTSPVNPDLLRRFSEMKKSQSLPQSSQQSTQQSTPQSQPSAGLTGYNNQFGQDSGYSFVG